MQTTAPSDLTMVGAIIITTSDIITVTIGTVLTAYMYRQIARQTDRQTDMNTCVYIVICAYIYIYIYIYMYIRMYVCAWIRLKFQYYVDGHVNVSRTLAMVL